MAHHYMYVGSTSVRTSVARTRGHVVRVWPKKFLALGILFPGLWAQKFNPLHPPLISQKNFFTWHKCRILLEKGKTWSSRIRTEYVEKGRLKMETFNIKHSQRNLASKQLRIRVDIQIHLFVMMRLLKDETNKKGAGWQHYSGYCFQNTSFCKY